MPGPIPIREKYFRICIHQILIDFVLLHDRTNSVDPLSFCNVMKCIFCIYNLVLIHLNPRLPKTANEETMSPCKVLVPVLARNSCGQCRLVVIFHRSHCALQEAVEATAEVRIDRLYTVQMLRSRRVTLE